MSGTQTSSAVAIIGSGFGGLGMAYYLKRSGIDSLVIFEKANEVGGTWRENTYPGAGCDVPSHLYSYSFEQHYPWKWRYAKQPEILEYQRHCASKYDIRRHVRFGQEVTGADFDAARGLWRIRLADGGVHEAQFLISSVGQLHKPAYPKIPGLDSFKGRAFHSAHWDHGYDLRGKTVAVIGTGASAVQFVPEVARQVARMHVFQRTPGWTVPKVDTPFSKFGLWLLAQFPWIGWLDRGRIFGIGELLAYAYQGHKWLEKMVTGLAKFQLWRQVRDPVLRARLTPDYPIGCKRILLSNDWLPALARDNVEVVSERIDSIEPTGIRTADGRLREVDALIYGTGFAATDFLAPMDIRGLNGRSLREGWKSGAEAYLGMSAAGFPNLFMLYGPNTNVGSGSIIFMLECQQRYVTQMIEAQRADGWAYADIRAEVQTAFVQEVATRSATSTFTGNCQSWYKTADGRNTNNWIGSGFEFRDRTAQPDLSNYTLVQAQSAQKAA